MSTQHRIFIPLKRKLFYSLLTFNFLSFLVSCLILRFINNLRPLSFMITIIGVEGDWLLLKRLKNLPMEVQVVPTDHYFQDVKRFHFLGFLEVLLHYFMLLIFDWVRYFPPQ